MITMRILSQCSNYYKNNLPTFVINHDIEIPTKSTPFRASGCMIGWNFIRNTSNTGRGNGRGNERTISEKIDAYMFILRAAERRDVDEWQNRNLLAMDTYWTGRDGQPWQQFLKMESGSGQNDSLHILLLNVWFFFVQSQKVAVLQDPSLIYRWYNGLFQKKKNAVSP